MFGLWYTTLFIRKPHVLKDEDILAELEEIYQKIQTTDSNKSMAKRYMTQEVFDRVKFRRTARGNTLKECILTGAENPQYDIGLFAVEKQCYPAFYELFHPILDELHFLNGTFDHQFCHPMRNFGSVMCFKDLDPSGEFVLSTRVICRRNLKGYAFLPVLCPEELCQIETQVKNALRVLPGEEQGVYTSYSDLTEALKSELGANNFLFTNDDPVLESIDGYHDWPEGRGVFIAYHKKCVLWVNEEDHVQLIVIADDGNLKEIWARFLKHITVLECRLCFDRDMRYGIVTMSPMYLGTGLQVTCLLKLPNFAKCEFFLEEICAKYHLLSNRGEQVPTYFITTRGNLGKNEYDSLKCFQKGILELIDSDGLLGSGKLKPPHRGLPKPMSGEDVEKLLQQHKDGLAAREKRVCDVEDKLCLALAAKEEGKNLTPSQAEAYALSGQNSQTGATTDGETSDGEKGGSNESSKQFVGKGGKPIMVPCVPKRPSVSASEAELDEQSSQDGSESETGSATTGVDETDSDATENN